MDISIKKAKPDKVNIQQALLTYVTPFDQTLALTEAERVIWKARFSKKACQIN